MCRERGGPGPPAAPHGHRGACTVLPWKKEVCIAAGDGRSRVILCPFTPWLPRSPWTLTRWQEAKAARLRQELDQLRAGTLHEDEVGVAAVRLAEDNRELAYQLQRLCAVGLPRVAVSSA